MRAYPTDPELFPFPTSGLREVDLTDQPGCRGPLPDFRRPDGNTLPNILGSTDRAVHPGRAIRTVNGERC